MSGESIGINKSSRFYCAEDKPNYVYEVVNPDNNLQSRFLGQFKDQFYLIGKPKVQPTQRDILTQTEIKEVLLEGENLQATDSQSRTPQLKKSHPTGALRQITVTQSSYPPYKITHIRFVGCINAADLIKNKLYTDKNAFEKALERK